MLVTHQTIGLHPVEHFVDPRNGRRLRRRVLGSCATGLLGVGTVAKASGLDLYFRNRRGTMPGHGEFDQALTRFVEQCWSEQTRKPGRPQYQKLNDSGVYWIASLPVIGTYHVDKRPDGGCELYRLTPVIRRPRG